MNITTKFTIATEQGLETLLMLTRELAVEQYASIVDRALLDRYIAENFHKKALIHELNSMSNQWLVVYADNKPAGYARITTRGSRPPFLEGKRSVRIADFGILSTFAATAVADSLLHKCLSVCRSQPGVQIWVNEHAGSPWIELFERNGFTRMQETFALDGLPLPSVCLIA
nr:GNAT family N-acetyltransferase [uncultured Dyadobacter sp.]